MVNGWQKRQLGGSPECHETQEQRHHCNEIPHLENWAPPKLETVSPEQTCVQIQILNLYPPKPETVSLLSKPLCANPDLQARLKIPRLEIRLLEGLKLSFFLLRDLCGKPVGSSTQASTTSRQRRRVCENDCSRKHLIIAEVMDCCDCCSHACHIGNGK